MNRPVEYIWSKEGGWDSRVNDVMSIIYKFWGKLHVSLSLCTVHFESMTLYE